MKFSKLKLYGAAVFSSLLLATSGSQAGTIGGGPHVKDRFRIKLRCKLFGSDSHLETRVIMAAQRSENGPAQARRSEASGRK
jgi:hypothetical protein